MEGKPRKRPKRSAASAHTAPSPAIETHLDASGASPFDRRDPSVTASGTIKTKGGSSGYEHGNELWQNRFFGKARTNLCRRFPPPADRLLAQNSESTGPQPPPPRVRPNCINASINQPYHFRQMTRLRSDIYYWRRHAENIVKSC